MSKEKEKKDHITPIKLSKSEREKAAEISISIFGRVNYSGLYSYWLANHDKSKI